MFCPEGPMYFCIIFISMPDFKVLESGELDSSGYSNSIKLQYLVEEKNRMEVELEELRLNNKILRNINADLVKDSGQVDLTCLIDRNQNLENSLEKIGKDRQKLVDELFILNQIRMESEKELQQISNNYQEKIIELRRSIQFKESILQKAEAQAIINQDFEEIVLPPYNVSMHFYEEFQEYKLVNKTLKDSNNKFKQQNQRLIQENTILKETLTKFENLANSQCSFLEFRCLLKEDRAHSLPHKAHKKLQYLSLNSRLQKQSKIESNEITGNTFSEITNKKNMMMRRVLKSKQIQNNELKEKLMTLTNKNKQLTKSMQTLLQSNKFYQKTRAAQNDKLQGFRMEAERYKQVLLRRRPYIRAVSNDKQIWSELKPCMPSNSQQKQKRKIVVDELRKAKEVFKNMSEPIRKVKKRSNSCLIDYTKCQIEQVKEEQKILQKNQGCKLLADETIGFQNEFSIIAGGKKTTYADLKRGKASNNIVKIGGFLDEIF